MASKPPVKHRKRRTGRQTLHYLLLLMVAGSILALLSFTVFFPVEEIQVQGLTRYATETILHTANIPMGTKMLQVREGALAKRLLQQYPYLETVKLHRIIPSTLIIQVTEAQPVGACETAMGYLVVDKNGRVLEINAPAPPQDVMVVSGMYFYNPALGRKLGTGYSSSEREQADLERESFTMLDYLRKAVEETQFDNITMIDFSDRLNMMLVYDNRIMIELGSEADLPYKLNFAKRLIQEQLSAGYTGVLDASLAAETKQVWSDPCDITELVAARRQYLGEQYAASSSETANSSSANTSSGAGSASESTSSGASSSSSEGQSASTSSQSVFVYTEDDLAVVPGTGSSKEESGSSADADSSS